MWLQGFHFFSRDYLYRNLFSLPFGYSIPAIVLFVLGCWFMLFSFKIVKASFRKTVVLIGPIFVLVCAAIAIAVYYIQKKHRELIIQNEEPEIFADEDLVSVDLENQMENQED